LGFPGVTATAFIAKNSEVGGWACGDRQSGVNRRKMQSLGAFEQPQGEKI